MMRIIYDNDIFLRQKYGGIRLYFTSLIAELANYPVSIHPNPSRIRSIYPRSTLSNSLSHLLRVTRSFGRGLRLPSEELLIYHPTYYSDPFLSSCNLPFVVTIHDLIHEKYSEFFESCYPRQRLKSYVAAKLSCMVNATAIIAVSQATADDIIDFYPFIDSSKLFVIPHGSDHLSSFSIAPSQLSPSLEAISRDPFFLFVGSRLNYKGFHILLRSFMEVCKDSPFLRLICVGVPFSSEENMAISDLGLSANVAYYSALNSELPYLYSASLGFVYPSFCEGFGLPILEALSFSCPVICSDIPPFREVGGDLPFYYPPHNPRQLSTLLRHIAIHSSSIRKSQCLSSVSRSRQYCWSDTAKLTFQLYSSILSL